jgi:hypothetical protein
MMEFVLRALALLGQESAEVANTTRLTHTTIFHYFSVDNPELKPYTGLRMVRHEWSDGGGTGRQKLKAEMLKAEIVGWRLGLPGNCGLRIADCGPADASLWRGELGSAVVSTAPAGVPPGDPLKSVATFKANRVIFYESRSRKAPNGVLECWVIGDMGNFCRVFQVRKLPNEATRSNPVKPSQTGSNDCGLRIADCGFVKPGQTQSNPSVPFLPSVLSSQTQSNPVKPKRLV